MNMSASNKNLILFLLGVIVLVAAWFLYVSPTLEDKKTIENQNQQLQNRLNELQAKSAEKAKYEEGIKVYNDKFDEKLSLFPATLDQEYTIEFVEGLRQAFDFDATALTMGEPEQFYVIGSNVAETTEAGAAGQTTEAEGQATTEAAGQTSTEAGQTAEGANGETEPTIDEDSLVVYKAEFPITYEGNYEGIKEMLNYVADYRYRMTVDTSNIAYDASSDLYTGDIVLVSYAVSGQGRTDAPLNLDIETGVSNLFTGSGSGSGGGTGSAGLTKYDGDNGAAIATDYDFYVMLNPADSDVSAKVVGQDGKDASKVSSTVNDEETLKLDFHEKDGKNYVTYTLGTESYEAEITSSDDATVYVTSSARKGADDKSSVKVTITNTMSIPVYIKVSDDDATSPRFNVTSKTGQVKVYK